MVDIIRIKYKTVFPLLIFLASLYIVNLIVIGIRFFDSVNVIFLLTQLIFVPISSIIILFLFNDLFGTDNTLFLYTYYKKRTINIYAINLLIFLLPMAFVCIMLTLQYEGFNGLAALLLLLTELLLFSSLSLLLFSLTSDISITITLVILYISIEIATFGSYANFHHIFYMNLRENIHFDTLNFTIIINFIFGSICYRIFKTTIS